MRSLNGLEIAEFIKERQAKQVRRLVQDYGITPKIAIIVTVNNPVIDIYLKLKNKYGKDIGVSVDIYRIKLIEVEKLLNKLSEDESVHGVIVQLPLEDISQTDHILNYVPPSKDVDGLNLNTKFDPATPMAILWLMSGYNIELKGKDIVLVGKGKLVGAPLQKMLIESDLNPRIIDRKTRNINEELIKADIIISATGVPGLIKSDMIKNEAVVIDAGVASENGKTSGDVDLDVYTQRIDLTITPIKGGVGPLTVCAVFENLIKAAENSINTRN